MANRSRPTQLKRQRERAKAEQRNQKSARRQEVKANRAPTERGPGVEDPDIAGILPGPQPSPYDELPGDFSPDDFSTDEPSTDEPSSE